jgi:hypothetical protein
LHWPPGIARQVSGAAQDLYRQARDTAADAASAARDTASSFEKWLRDSIEWQPTTALIAVGPLVSRQNASTTVALFRRKGALGGRMLLVARAAHAGGRIYFRPQPLADGLIRRGLRS